MSAKVMGSLGTADGAVLRCLNILHATYARASHGVRSKLTNEEVEELMEKLDKAHQAILIAAHELEKEQS